MPYHIVYTTLAVLAGIATSVAIFYPVAKRSWRSELVRVLVVIAAIAVVASLPRLIEKKWGEANAQGFRDASKLYGVRAELTERHGDTWVALTEDRRAIEIKANNIDPGGPEPKAGNLVVSWYFFDDRDMATWSVLADRYDPCKTANAKIP